MKICPLCGKENKKRAEICSCCGFNFSGTGHIPGGRRTSEPAKEKKAGKILKVAAVSLAVMLVISVAGLLIHNLRTMKYHENFDPVILISKGDILLYDLQRPSAKPLKFAQAEDETQSGEGYRKAYLTKDRSTLVFSNSFEYYDDYFSVQCDVYTYDLEALPYFPKTVLRDVAYWTVSENGDIYTYEKPLGGSLWLFQRLKGEDVPVTDKYKVYSVSADGKELVYSNKSRKLKLKTGDSEKNIRSFSVAELTDTADNTKITFSSGGADITVELPEGFSADGASLIITEKGSVLLTEKGSGVFLLRNNRFVLLAEGEQIIVPEYPDGEADVVNYDFSVLSVK